MALAAGAYAIGPENGQLHLRTTREGAAARIGHDLLIEVGAWSGRLSVDGDGPVGARLTVEAETGSLAIVAGSGGAVPLSAGDRTDIVATARRLLDVDHYPQAAFASDEVDPAPDGDGGTLRGTLTLLGRSRPVAFEVAAAGPGRWRATATLLQSQFGIRPYQALFGALRLADPVTVEVSVDVGSSLL